MFKTIGISEIRILVWPIVFVCFLSGFEYAPKLSQDQKRHFRQGSEFTEGVEVHQVKQIVWLR